MIIILDLTRDVWDFARGSPHNPISSLTEQLTPEQQLQLNDLLEKKLKDMGTSLGYILH